MTCAAPNCNKKLPGNQICCDHLCAKEYMQYLEDQKDDE